MRKLLIIVIIIFCQACCGCRVESPKFELTMKYPDGQTKTFVGYSVTRYDSNGEWRYVEADGTVCYFKGEATIKPVLDLTPAPVASESLLAEELPAIKND